MNNKKIVISAIILVIVFAAVFFIYKDFFGARKQNTDEEVLTEIENAENLENLPEQQKQNNSETSQNGNLSISTIIPKEKIPDLSKPIVIKTNLPEYVKKETIEKINALSNSLKKDYDSLEEWLEIGLLRKLIGDYDGARDAWEFAALIRPKDPVSRHNLGFIYWQNFKDYKKAEENYLKAIENNSRDIGAYIDLSNVYYFSLKDTARAKEILDKGLKNNPRNEEIKQAFLDMNL